MELVASVTRHVAMWTRVQDWLLVLVENLYSCTRTFCLSQIKEIIMYFKSTIRDGPTLGQREAIAPPPSPDLKKKKKN